MISEIKNGIDQNSKVPIPKLQELDLYNNKEHYELFLQFTRNKNKITQIASLIEENSEQFIDLSKFLKELIYYSKNPKNLFFERSYLDINLAITQSLQQTTEERATETKNFLKKFNTLPPIGKLPFEIGLLKLLTTRDQKWQKVAGEYLDLLLGYINDTLNQKSSQENKLESQYPQENHDFSKLQKTVSEIINKTNLNDKDKTIKDYTQTINNLASLPDGVEEPDYIHDIFANSAVLDAGRDRKRSYVYFFQERLNKNNYDIGKFITPSVIRELYSFSTLLVCIEKFENVRKKLGIENPQGKKDAVDKIYKILDEYNKKLSIQNEANTSQQKKESYKGNTGLIGTIQGLRNMFSSFFWPKK